MAEGRGVIEHIEIEGFKSLERVSLDLGPLNIFVGTNASGKTMGLSPWLRQTNKRLCTGRW